MIAFARVALVLATMTLSVPAAPVRPAPVHPANDDFAQRQVLPSMEQVSAPLGDIAGVSFEALDPLYTYTYGEGLLHGSLWWSWTAPRDGWFIAETPALGWNEVSTYVFHGQSLEMMVPVLNGNFRGLSVPGYRTIFEAKQGEQFSIGVQGLWVNSSDTAGRNGGTLMIRPAPARPSNDSLAARAVLSGALPLTFTTHNVIPGTQEMDLLSRMQLLAPERGGSPLFRGVLWWEWRCPETARYRATMDGGAGLHFHGARRRSLPENPDGIPGNWEVDGMDAAANTFEAEAGRVYDIALASSGFVDEYTVLSHDEISGGLERVSDQTAQNTEKSKAIALPGIAPLITVLELRPGNEGAEPGGQVPMWWKYTAPEAGIYQLLHHGYPFVHREDGAVSYDPALVLHAGETIWFNYNHGRYEQSSASLEILRLPLPANDHLADAVDLGSAVKIKIEGHRDVSSVEPGEPAIREYDRITPATASQWWRWTAPGSGWLTTVSGRGLTTVELFEGDTIPSLQLRESFVSSASVPVEAGKTYRIRAAAKAGAQSGSFSLSYQFAPYPPPGSWSEAVDLGVTDRPEWRPVADLFIYGGAYSWDRRFKWTSKNGGPAFLSAWEDSVRIFTDPANEVELPPSKAPARWDFQAGRTYWLRLVTHNSSGWFFFQPAKLASRRDPATAGVLGPALPAAGTENFLGDTNSEAEIAVMKHFIPEDQLRSKLPVIWWKWQAPEDQWVRLFTDQLAGAVRDTVVFSGAAPSPDNAVRTQIALLDLGARYFQAERGKVYWIAVTGEENLANEQYARVELRPAVHLPVSNDDFQHRAVISSAGWKAHESFYGLHLLTGGSNPLQFEHQQATLESREPPVALVIGENGNVREQTATTWWHWTAPASGLFKFTISRISRQTFLQRLPPPGGSPPDVNDLTANVYTGETLPALQPLILHEPGIGQYIFRAEAGTQYTIRIASSEDTLYYVINPQAPSLEEIYNFTALENLEFEETGNAWGDYPGDGVPNVVKLIFGLDLDSDYRSPVNNAVRHNLPHFVFNPGFLELRFRPLAGLLPEGDPVLFEFHGRRSTDLVHWELISAQAAGNGELTVRLPTNGDRGFLEHALFFGTQYVEFND